MISNLEGDIKTRELAEKLAYDIEHNNCAGIFVLTSMATNNHRCGGYLAEDFDFVADQVSALIYQLAAAFNMTQDQVLAEVKEHVELRKRDTRVNPNAGRNLH